MLTHVAHAVGGGDHMAIVDQHGATHGESNLCQRDEVLWGHFANVAVDYASS